ncbi:MAG TPA: class I SAM-dependent methyltransferase [Gemmatimonadales bacterium]
MFTKSARFYDSLYAFKDYAGAASEIRQLVRARRPAARSLLDVACGTGRHLEALRADFTVEGLDLNPDLLRIARERLPDTPLHQADMTSFDLGRRFDVVTCLFSSIGYVRTAERLRRAVARMAAHVAPGGLLLIEPWFSAESYWTGTITGNFVDEPELKIAWMYVSERRDHLSVLDIHYMVGRPEGIEQFNEVHEMGLFTPDEYAAAIRDAGMEHESDDRGFFGRGLHVGFAPAAR